METTPITDDFRRYIGLLQRWIWLLLLGLILGAASAYIFSRYQPQVYQTSTKLMFLKSRDDQLAEFFSASDAQLARTYIQLITTDPVLELLSQRLGFPVFSAQIGVRQLPDSLILEITTEDQDPFRAMVIANTLVEVFIEYNETIQTNRFVAAEASLQAQIQQVDAQISSLQNEMSQLNEETLKTQQSQVEQQIRLLEGEMNNLKDEIAQLQPPTEQVPLVIVSGDGSVTTPTPSPTQDPLLIAQLDEKQTALAQLQPRYDLYQQIYLNLLVLGQPVATGVNQDLRLNQLQNTLSLYQQIYSNLLNSYENIRLARVQNTPNVIQVEKATSPLYPIRPQPVRNSLLGGMVGLMVMGMIALLIEYLDDTLRTPTDVNRELGLPVLGVITKHEPGSIPPVTMAQPRSPVSEAFRSLRTNIQYASVDHPLQVVLVTSPSPKEGKSTVAVNLAVTLAQSGRQVAMLETDLRRPKIHKLLSLSNRAGITDLFTQNPVSLNGHFQETAVPNLQVITSGTLPPNPSELLGSQKLLEILDCIREMFDIVILDSPPTLAVTDPTVLAPRVDGVLLVLKPGETKIGAARQSIEQLRRVGAKIIGVVLNEVEIKGSRYSHYYKDYYSAYQEYYAPRSNDNPNDKERQNKNKEKG